MTNVPSSPRQSPLDAAIEAMMETLSRVTGMTGVRPCGTTAATSLLTGAGVQGLVAVGVSFTGWSAAMRRQTMEWRIEVPTGPMPDGSEPTREFLGDAMAMTYGPRMVLQVQRARLAQSHGLGTFADERLSPNHFLVDRSVATLLASARVDPGALVTWHRRNSADEGTVRAVAAKGAYPSGRVAIPRVAIGTEPTTDHALLAPEIAISRPGGTAATLFDREVRVAARIPESLLVACAGMRLGDVVETGVAHLDERRIEMATGTGDASRFTLERDRITVADAALMLPVPPRPSPHRSTAP